MHVESGDVDSAVATRWDKIASDGELYATQKWLRATAPVGVRAAGFRLLNANGDIAAALPGYVLTAGCGVSSFANAGEFLPIVLNQVGHEDAAEAAAVLLPTLSLGGLIPHYQHLLTSPATDRRTAADELIHEAVSVAHARGLSSVSFLYVDAADQVLGAALEEAGFLPFYSGEKYDLHMEWACFDDYLAHFKRKRRGSIRREMADITSAGITIDHVSFSEAPLIQMADCIAEHYRKYGREVTRDEVVRELAAIPAEVATVWTAIQQGAPIGFAVGVSWGAHLYMRTVAIDSHWADKYPIYFSLLFYEPIRVAISSGIRHIHFGPTADQAKELRGCMKTEQTGYILGLEPAAVERLTEWLPELQRKVGI